MKFDKSMLPPEYVMQEMSRLAFEMATTSIAQKAEEMAKSDIVRNISGHEALMLFASAMRKTTDKIYGAPNSEN